MSISSRAKLAWGVGIVVSSLSAISLTIALWASVGWTTPAQHKADIDAMIATRMVSEKNVIDAIKESRDEWKCDEYEEELIDALHEQEDGDNSVELRRLIEKIKKKMDTLNCDRFEDFG